MSQNQNKPLDYDSDAILKKITKSVIDDYFTGSVKAEVSLDMLLTPVIADILNLAFGITDENKKLKYVTKEFPMVTGNSGLSSSKADYLLCDDEYVYLVELKTSVDSIDTSESKSTKTKKDDTDENQSDIDPNDLTQLGRYRGLINEYFTSAIGDSFIKVLLSNCTKEIKILLGLSPKNRMTASEKEDFKKTVSEIYNQNTQIPEAKIFQIWKPTDENPLRGTRKYITQAYQVHNAVSLVDKKIKVIYLVPSLPSKSGKIDAFEDINTKESFNNWRDYDTEKVGAITFDRVISAWKTPQESEKANYIDWLINDIFKVLFLP